MQLKQMKKLAQQFREERLNLPDYGFVIFWMNEPTGWVLTLEEPRHWQPGCIALDFKGALWEARGGNEQAGAERWESITHGELTHAA